MSNIELIALLLIPHQLLLHPLLFSGLSYKVTALLSLLNYKVGVSRWLADLVRCNLGKKEQNSCDVDANRKSRLVCITTRIMLSLEF